MKNHLIILLSIVVLTCSEAGANERRIIRENEFPRIGASYELTYDVKPEGHYWPLDVKIIAKGEGQWYLVEYERTEPSSRRVIRKPLSEPTPTPQPTPTPALTVTIERQWINFALLPAANEK
jgi:hypothetical protein